jgi:hypothetical protein
MHIQDVLLPAHPNSHDRKGERVAVIPLNLKNMKMELEDMALYVRDEEERQQLRLVSEAIDAVVEEQRARKIDLDAVATSLSALRVDYEPTFKRPKESTKSRFEAQYSARAVFDPFWTITGDDLTTEWIGLELIRITSRSRREPAFRLICAMLPSTDGLAFTVRPLAAQVNRAKAKVLYTRWWQFWTWFYSCLLRPGEEVKIAIDMEVEASWVDAKHTAHHDIIGAFRFSLPRYNLSEPHTLALQPQVLLEGTGLGGLPPARRRLRRGAGFGFEGGWFPIVPTYKDAKGHVMSQGILAVRTIVTERDPSNARKLSEAGASILKSKASDK